MKETLEEYAENSFKYIDYRNSFIAGAKWQQKRSYSEEEVEKLTLTSLDLGMAIRQDQLRGYSIKSGKELHKDWFEQFKNK